MKTKYIYPAVFCREDVGYSVSFPDIDCCFTSGKTLEEAIDMAKDALCLMLYDMEESKQQIPEASDITEIQCKCNSNEFTSFIECDTLEYRRYFYSKAVKKTLSIPAWLNTMAEREDINFSAVLQRALKLELNI